jgi:uncharacterized protein
MRHPTLCSRMLGRVSDNRGGVVAAKYVIKSGRTGKFRFNLLATNGQVIATSETYETKRACLAGIESVRKNATNAVVDDQTAAASSKRRG